MPTYQNYYKCDCGTEWQDEWDCMCDDRCPVCNTSTQPYDSAEIDDVGEVIETHHHHDPDEDDQDREGYGLPSFILIIPKG